MKYKLKFELKEDWYDGAPIDKEIIKEWVKEVKTSLEGGHNPAWVRSGDSLVFGHQTDKKEFTIYIITGGYKSRYYSSKKIK